MYNTRQDHTPNRKSFMKIPKKEGDMVDANLTQTDLGEASGKENIKQVAVSSEILHRHRHSSRSR